MTTDRKRDIFTPKISINLRYYTDDGWSGTNFDRHDWKRMLADIEDGIVGSDMFIL